VHRAEHTVVPDQRTHGVHDADHARRLFDRRCTAEEDRRHLHSVLGRFVVCAAGHQRLVGVAHHEVVHVEVPRFYRKIHRLHDAGVDAVNLRRHVRGLTVEVRKKGGASGRAVYHVVATDHAIHLGVARLQLEARRRPGERFAHEASIKVHDVAVDLQPCAAQQLQCGFVGDAVADLFEYPKRGCVDGFDALGGDEFESRPGVGPHVHGVALSRHRPCQFTSSRPT